MQPRSAAARAPTHSVSAVRRSATVRGMNSSSNSSGGHVELHEVAKAHKLSWRVANLSPAE